MNDWSSLLRHKAEGGLNGLTLSDGVIREPNDVIVVMSGIEGLYGNRGDSYVLSPWVALPNGASIGFPGGGQRWMVAGEQAGAIKRQLQLFGQSVGTLSIDECFQRANERTALWTSALAGIQSNGVLVQEAAVAVSMAAEWRVYLRKQFGKAGYGWWASEWMAIMQLLVPFSRYSVAQLVGPHSQRLALVIGRAIGAKQRFGQPTVGMQQFYDALFQCGGAGGFSLPKS